MTATRGRKSAVLLGYLVVMLGLVLLVDFTVGTNVGLVVAAFLGCIGSIPVALYVVRPTTPREDTSL